MLADFAVVPMGVTGGVKELVAEALKIVDESGLSYKLGAMRTTIEGDSDRVMDVILRCHRRMLELAILDEPAGCVCLNWFHKNTPHHPPTEYLPNTRIESMGAQVLR